MSDEPLRPGARAIEAPRLLALLALLIVATAIASAAVLLLVTLPDRFHADIVVLGDPSHTVAASSDGVVTAIEVRPGDRVQPGDVIARIDPRAGLPEQDRRALDGLRTQLTQLEDAIGALLQERLAAGDDGVRLRATRSAAMLDAMLQQRELRRDEVALRRQALARTEAALARGLVGIEARETAEAELVLARIGLSTLEVEIGRHRELADEADALALERRSAALERLVALTSERARAIEAGLLAHAPVVVHAREAGVISSVLVRPGEGVAKGGAIVELGTRAESRRLEAQVDAAAMQRIRVGDDVDVQFRTQGMREPRKVRTRVSGVAQRQLAATASPATGARRDDGATYTIFLEATEAEPAITDLPAGSKGRAIFTGARVRLLDYVLRSDAAAATG
jgi:multidrug resistance efflux pump